MSTFTSPELRQRREQDTVLRSVPPARPSRDNADPKSALVVSQLPATWLKRHAGPDRSMPVCDDPMDGDTAFYCRYSTKAQREESIERQVDICAAYCKDRDYSFTQDDIYIDQYKSAEGIWSRKGLMTLLDRLTERRYRRVVLYDASRLSRNYSDLPWLHNAVERCGAELHSANNNKGRLRNVDVMFETFHSAEQRTTLMTMSRYERRKMARAGLSPTGKCYGYDLVPNSPGELVTNDREAGHVRWIFSAYLGGLTPGEIARDLESRKVISPSGTPFWSDGGIRQILVRPIYRGLLVYGKYQWWKDTAGNRSKRTKTSVEEWDCCETPHLSIVDVPTWEAAQEQVSRRSELGAGGERPGEYLLARRVKCPSCDTGFLRSVPGRRIGTIRCADFTRKRGCTDSTKYLMADVEATVLGGVTAALGDDDHRALFRRLHGEALDDLSRHASDGHEELDARIAAKTAEFEETFKRPSDDDPLARDWDRLVAKVRGRVHGELMELEAMRDLHRGRMRRADLLDDARLASLHDAMADMMARVPFRPVEGAGFTLRNQVRDFVRRVDLSPGMTPGSFHVVVTVCLDEADEPAPIEIRATFDPPAGVTADDTKRDRLRTAAGKADVALTDAEWAQVRSFVPVDVGRRKWSVVPVPDRSVVDAGLFKAAHHAPWRLMPSTFGDPRDVESAVRRMTRGGLWAAIVARLREVSPERFAELDATPLTGPFKKRNRRRRAG